jgi:SnoaL-like domain
MAVMVTYMPENDEVLRILERLDTLESQDAIRRLKATYMQLCDEGPGRKIAELFWEDGVWEELGRSGLGAIVGRTAIGEMLGSNPAQLSFAVHYLTNESIEVRGNEATGRWKLFEPCTFRHDQALWQGGWYADDFERRGGVWKFTRLRLKLTYRTPFDEGWARTRFADLSE